MRNVAVAALCSVFLLGIIGMAPTDKAETIEAEKTETKKKESEKVYRHLVLFKFKEDATKEQIEQVVAAFGNLKNEINTVLGYEFGTDVSPEKLAKGFSHCFLVTFRNKKDLEAYLPHPAHQAFTVKLKPILADVLVVDYWAES